MAYEFSVAVRAKLMLTAIHYLLYLLLLYQLNATIIFFKFLTVHYLHVISDMEEFIILWSKL